MLTSQQEQANLKTTSQHDAWYQWLFLWHILFYSLLVILTIATASGSTDQVTSMPLEILLSIVLFGSWYLGSVIFKPNIFQQKPLISMIYFGLGWLLWYILIGYDAIFLFISFSLFPHVFMYVKLPYSIVGSLILNLLVVSQLFPNESDLSATIGVFLLILVLGSTLLAKFINSIIEQSNQRKQLIIDLQATRENLDLAEREAGILQERQRLANEIHDTLTQGFIGIITHLEATEININNQNKAEHHIKVAKNLARTNLAESRRFIWNLPSSALDTNSYVESIRQVIKTWGKNHQIPVSFSISGTVVILSEEIQLNLLRILQEALANIFKHAQATHVSVTMTYFDDSILLDVKDDGIGFDTTQVNTGGFGLNGMRQRAELMKGSMVIESDCDEGTTIVAEFPLLIDVTQ